MEKDNNNDKVNENGEDDFVFSPDAVSRWADASTSTDASLAATGGLTMPALEPIDMEVVEEELERAERGAEVSDAAIGRIVEGDSGRSGDSRGMSAYERKEQKSVDKKRKREEEEDVEFETGSVNASTMRKNKSSQTEMTRMATLRKEEKRQDTRRSGTQPELEGPFEGAGQRHGVEIVQWDDLTKEKRRDLTRASEGKFKKKIIVIQPPHRS